MLQAVRNAMARADETPFSARNDRRRMGWAAAMAGLGLGLASLASCHPTPQQHNQHSDAPDTTQAVCNSTEPAEATAMTVPHEPAEIDGATQPEDPNDNRDTPPE